MTRIKYIYSSFLISLVITLIGVALSCLIASESAEWIAKTEKERFNIISEQIAYSIKDSIKENVQLLQNAAIFMTSLDDVTRDEWKYFCDHNNLKNTYIGLEALGYAPKINQEERHSFEQKMRSNEVEKYTIFPQSTGPYIYPIMYIEPFTSSNRNALGFDMISEKIRQTAIQRAIDSGTVTISSKIELVHEKNIDEKAGFAIYFPVYGKNTLLSNIEERRAALKGLIVAGFKASNLFNSLLKSKFIAFDFAIYDGNTPVETQKLYDSNPSLNLPRLERYLVLDLYGKQWTLYFKANEVLDMNASHYLPWIELLLGTILSFSLGGWVYALQRTRKEAYHIAEEKTQKLSQSEAEVRSIFQAMSEGIIVMSADGIVTECNLAAQEILQLSSSEILGHSIEEVKWKTFKEDGTLFKYEERPSYKALYNGEHQFNVIVGIQRRNDSFVWVMINAQPILNDDFSNISSAVMTFNDITAYRASKRQLEEYIKIIDANVIISETDIHGIITDVSDAFCHISGYSKEELLGKNHHIVKHPDMPNSVYIELWKSLHASKTWRGEIKNLRKDGTSYWVDAIISPRYNEAGEKIGYTAIRQDITDKKRIEELSITDKLTGLYNRLKLDNLFAYHLGMTKRYGLNLSIALLDIDKFKMVNDTFGHQVGDSVLQELSTLVKNNIRLEDALGRWGGEEFLIIMPSNTLESAINLAEKLRQKVEAFSFTTVGQRTVSFGIATYHTGDDEKSMVSRADKALYSAKENGRNRVEIED